MNRTLDRAKLRRTAIILAAIGLAEAIPLGFMLVSARTHLARSLDFTGTHAASGIGWLLAAIVTVAYCAVATSRLPTLREHMFNPHPIKLAGIAFAVPTGILEEAYFRRYLMDATAAAGGIVAVQIIVSTLAFGAVHAVWGLFRGNVRAALSAMIATSVLGLALAIVYVAGGRSVAPCIVAHVAINAVLEPWLIYSALAGDFGSRARTNA